MEKFITQHPWMTFFIAIAAIDGIVYIVRGPPKMTVTVPPGTQLAPGTQLGAGNLVSGNLVTSHGIAGAKLMPWLNPVAYMRG
jgi:hypothetical protein